MRHTTISLNYIKQCIKINYQGKIEFQLHLYITLARRFGVLLVLVRKLKAKMVPGGLL